MPSQDTHFEPGQSGNPAGRPKGSRNRSTLALEAIFEGDGEALSRKAIELAMEGDGPALKLCLDRLLPPRRDRSITFDLPVIETAADLPLATAALLRAVSSGEITPSESADIGQHHPRHPHAAEQVVGIGCEADRPPCPVAPGHGLRIPPTAVAEVEHDLTVRASAPLASPHGPPEADRGRELRPVDRVEEAVLAPDRHQVAVVGPFKAAPSRILPQGFPDPTMLPRRQFGAQAAYAVSPETVASAPRARVDAGGAGNQTRSGELSPLAKYNHSI